MIYIGSDHAGYKLKERIKVHLSKMKIPYEDLGTYSMDSVDYPDYARKVVSAVLKNNQSKGILICGTGTGMVIAANRTKGVRAVSVYDNYSARMARHDNNANIICLKGRRANFEKELDMLKVWLKGKFSGLQRHKRRIKKLDA